MNNFQRSSSIFKGLLRKASWVIDQAYCVPTVRKNLYADVSSDNKSVIKYLSNIRFLSFAFLTSPVLSLIPFAITNQIQWGLINFAIGTFSIILWLFVFRNLRLKVNPVILIRWGAISTVIFNILIASALILASVFNISSNIFIFLYLSLQIFSGISFSLITGIDSKLSGTVFRSIKIKQSCISPNAEFRRCKTIGSTTANAFGSLLWSIVILFFHGATKQPGWYSVIFILGIIPAILLLKNLRLLSKTLLHKSILFELKAVDSEKYADKKKGYRLEMFESIISIGCLEGILQFSQFYFSIKAIKVLFEKVEIFYLLVLIIPLLFYFINYVEQIGAVIFSKFAEYKQFAKHKKNLENNKQRQNVSIVIIFISFLVFVIHTELSSNWSPYLDVVAYAFFNVIKGFAGGLSEKWNESLIENNPLHNEAWFTTLYSLFGRVYQVGSIIVFFLITQFINSNNWKDIFIFGKQMNPESNAFGAMLTSLIFGLMAANILAFIWLGFTECRENNPLKILVDSIVTPEKRLTLFTQILRALFVVCLLLSNFLSLKVFEYKGITFAHGSVFYISLFVIINLITVFEGIESATRTIFQGTVIYLVVYGSLIASAFVSGEIVSGQINSVYVYNALLKEIADLFAASFLAYILTVTLNILLLTFLLKYLGTRHALILTACVTLICQLIDTAIYVNVGYHNFGNLDITSMFFGQFMIKTLIYLIMYFPLYLIIKICKRFLVIANE